MKAGNHELVRASIIGAILANLLLAQGVGFFLGGLRYHDQEYNPRAARTYSTMMLIAAISLAIPSAFSRFFSTGGPIREEQLLNTGLAIVLLLAYVLYLVFMLRTHPETFQSTKAEEGRSRAALERPAGRRTSSPLGLAAWMSGSWWARPTAPAGPGMSRTFIGIVFVAIVGARRRAARRSRWP